jgi:hypothetical protein
LILQIKYTAIFCYTGGNLMGRFTRDAEESGIIASDSSGGQYPLKLIGSELRGTEVMELSVTLGKRV